MSTVGIIANPASGKDIRRLVAHASVFDNNEKINILQRILLALDAIGVDQVSIMPDYYGLGERALDGIHLPSLRADILAMPMTSSDLDSTVAAERLREMNVGAIIVLGGDGTNRVAAKGSGDVPIVPVSTGTNNVFPVMVEGTVVGMAAGMIARGLVDAGAVSYRAKRLDVYLDDQWADMALVDVVTSTDLFIGTRAIWHPSHLREIILSQAEPGRIGLSAVGGCFRTVRARDPHGMFLSIGAGGADILAPMGPGLVTRVPIRDHRMLAIGDEVQLDPEIGTIALDGERQIEIFANQSIRVRLTDRGPRVVDISHCMEEATRRGVFQQLGQSQEE